jgi:5-methylcytosine-specific restriction protein A
MDKDSFFFSSVKEADIRRERNKARALRNSEWWKRKRSKGVCYFCGASVPPRELTMDHVIPIIRGGKSVKSNVVPACKSCNIKKKYLLPTEWEEYLDSIK